MITNGDVLIRPMTEDDLDLMVKWLNNDEVLSFYEEPPSNLDRVKNKWIPRINGEHYVTPCIVEYKNESIGYIQYYEVQADKLMIYGYAAGQNVFGIDQFIGGPNLWGRGIGTSMILLMLNYLSKAKGAFKILLEVKKENPRAIASYEKCGFKKVKELIDGLVLMEWDWEFRN